MARFTAFSVIHTIQDGIIAVTVKKEFRKRGERNVRDLTCGAVPEFSWQDILRGTKYDFSKYRIMM
jgi:hypothetical protein